MSRFKYRVDLPRSSPRNTEAMKQWCRENLGPRWDILDKSTRNAPWHVLFYHKEDTGEMGLRWHFRDEKDMMLFMLRWA